MAGIVAALEPHHHIGARGQPVDDLSFAFVAPLGADHCNIGHEFASYSLRLFTPHLVLRTTLPTRGREGARCHNPSTLEGEGVRSRESGVGRRNRGSESQSA